MADTRTHDGLKYVGDGTQLGNVPTRDLTPAEVAKFGKAWLLKSGLYVEPERPAVKFVPKPHGAAKKKSDESPKEIQ